MGSGGKLCMAIANLSADTHNHMGRQTVSHRQGAVAAPRDGTYTYGRPRRSEGSKGGGVQHRGMVWRCIIADMLGEEDGVERYWRVSTATAYYYMGTAHSHLEEAGVM